MSRAPLDLSLYLVTDTGMTRRHGLSTTIRAAVAGGATVVQLRDPDASDEEFVALGLLARRALDGARSAAPLIVNDRVHLAERIGADGAHVGQSDLAPEAARAMLGDTAYLGLSCTSAEQVRAAAELPAGTVDYLGLGPVWATPSKVDHATPVGVDGLAELVAAATLPSVAIGGIDAARAAAVLATGVDGLAVVSGICSADDPQVAARDLADQVGAAR
ncbi:thiamine-phosphate diphosphorylase [Serinicoccus sp. CNJ-927]|uniref:thiamine phosphate synthase n=1 Tax=Serinicoccus sp. CNJ-927 TaxID=1904970 RepID=UPI000968E60B|nr:thiamine phosphate synthase [Serinicoccus sp. CNJ-927]OLT38922.1 thiamine-phosphate diphosphorylase [Serinicoccus sp. CNJ-927]